MKVIALTVTTLCLALVAEGYLDYHLKCGREELGVRWPSYHSNSEYYVCSRVGGKQLLMTCNPGELFTFVLQACTSPGKYIPPPPMDILPTSSPMGVKPAPNQPGQSGHAEEDDMPKPLYPNKDPEPPIMLPLHPPVATDEHPPNWEMPEILPPNHIDGDGNESSIESSEEDHDISVPVPVKPPLPGKPKPSKPQPAAPLPPTPAPTPPTLQNSPSKKQPPVPPNKKKPIAVPAKKQPPTEPAKKQPPAVPKKQAPTPPKA